MTTREPLAVELQRGLLMNVVDQVGEGVAVFDMEDRVVYANLALAEIQGTTVDQIVGLHLSAFIPEPPPGTEEQRSAAEQSGNGVLRAEMPGTRRDGSRVDVAITVSPLLDNSGEQIGRIVIVRDVTVRRLLEAQLERAALRDPLTDLPNRRLLSDRLEQALDRAESSGSAVAVVFIDLDGFKVVNDAYGHEAGDEVLRETALRLEACLSPADTLARLGGDELVVLVEDVTDLDQPMEKARQLLEALATPFTVGDSRMTITASIGVAMATTGPQRALLHAADEAMYEAKRSGPGRIVAKSPDAGGDRAVSDPGVGDGLH
ncbi:diguanylate cyclase domain-containing protein [Demequina sp. SO4-18]|uniref:diguanylate cyclase domain-containing protein n=1 Tax=Demequina sp. SO4-18 TaxID=3401026 RepID=UPI003B592D8C